MAGYGIKEAIREQRIAKGQHHAEGNSCGDCGAPVTKTELLCRDCRQTIVVMSPKGCRSYLP